MAQAMTRGQIQDLVGRFALENPKYRTALLKDPKGVIERQFNTSLGWFNIVAVSDLADIIHVVVPYVPPEGQLTDADLEKVSGGKQDIKADCTALALGGAAAGNTVTQVNL